MYEKFLVYVYRDLWIQKWTTHYQEKYDFGTDYR